MMNVDLDMPAAILHEAVSNRSGMPLEGFALYYQSKQLEGGAALSSWGVEKDATIEVKTRGRGGAKEGESSGNIPQHGAFWLRNVHDGRALCTLHSSDDRAHKGNQEASAGSSRSHSMLPSSPPQPSPPWQPDTPPPVGIRISVESSTSHPSPPGQLETQPAAARISVKGADGRPSGSVVEVSQGKQNVVYDVPRHAGAHTPQHFR